MKTAEEFFREKIKEYYVLPSGFSLANVNFLNAEKAMIWANDYAVYKSKMHVTEALKQASEKADKVGYKNGGFGDFNHSIDRQSILNAYPLDQIK